MDALLLSRLQFAVATYFHFLFVPLTLGLSLIIAFMETIYVRSGDEDYKRMAKFWGKLFLINFAVGIVTGITLEFQFGTNWSRYSSYVGDIFGSLLAIEATNVLFPGIHLHSRMGLRLEPAVTEDALPEHLAGGHSRESLSRVDSHCQFLDATPGGIRDQKRSG